MENRPANRSPREIARRSGVPAKATNDFVGWFSRSGYERRAVPVYARRRNRVSMPGEIAQKFVIKTGRLQHGSELGLASGVVIEHGEHLVVLVTQQEFDEPILQ